MGYWTAGPIKDPDQLGPTIKKAVEVVKAGRAGSDRRVDPAAVRKAFMNSRRVVFALAAVAAGLVLGSTSGFAASAERGREQFLKHGCWQCHGEKGQGGVAGRTLAPNPLPFEALAELRADDQPQHAAVSGRDPVE